MNQTAEPSIHADEDEQDYRRQLVAARLPSHLHDGLVDYLVHHIPPGSYLMAVLSNDLLNAVKRGDEQSLEALVPLVKFLYQHADCDAWGSETNVAEWLASRKGRT